MLVVTVAGGCWPETHGHVQRHTCQQWGVTAMPRLVGLQGTATQDKSKRQKTKKTKTKDNRPRSQPAGGAAIHTAATRQRQMSRSGFAEGVQHLGTTSDNHAQHSRPSNTRRGGREEGADQG